MKEDISETSKWKIFWHHVFEDHEYGELQNENHSWWWECKVCGHQKDAERIV